jgi:hypothetical protein
MFYAGMGSLRDRGSSVQGLPRSCHGVRLDCHLHLSEEIDLFSVIGDPHTLEHSVEPDIDVEVACILVEVQERVRTSRKVATLALPQLWELA